jgi:adenosylmethionine-8-amino-7-oxononanoate aminotransferase
MGQPQRRTVAAFAHAYHGDTLGAASLGGIPAFSGTAARLGLPVLRLHDVDELEALSAADTEELSAIIIEPLIQGAAGLRLWPAGMLRTLRDWCDRHEVLLIFDEVMTGFGRTGKMFAGEHEAVTPDFLCLAKGLTGGYSPLAATLTTARIFEAFLGAPEERRTFFYGHSYSGHPLGCAAALASLSIFRDEDVLGRLGPKIAALSQGLDRLRQKYPRHVFGVRQCGFVAGLEVGSEIVASDTPPRWGAAVCTAARSFGLLTRPIGNTVVLMPPLCTSDAELQSALSALDQALESVFSRPFTAG